ncbi:hypothetical protein EDB81DRAFT_872888 [Dactylonectria macrodidyma]|uniref:C2H2-type domain-containing protein n=1 Tax=Dactylonectria macrodidyma TaxID=307937 RepID=A0A9P9DM19_9HYPO|nr:hypothetical protein EDB81DRAFT_872888 [Dactylonectria macrodidyma]
MTQCETLRVTSATSLQRIAPQLRRDETELGCHFVPSGQLSTIPIRNRRRQASVTSRSSSDTQSCPTPPSSEDELKQSSSDAESDTENVRSDDEYTSMASQEYTLPEHHLFQIVRRGVFQSTRAEIQTWIANGSYSYRQGGKSTSYRRGRMSDWQHPSSRREEGGIEHPINQNLHFACPFYAFAPNNNQHCLMDDLQSNEEVNVHLRRHHMKSPYCPRCYSTFATVVDCDSHILDSKCELVEPRHVDGINHYQKSRLANMDTGYLSDLEQWRCMSAIVLPNLEPTASPYLDHGRGLVSSMVRDYWSMHGRRCVSQYLESRDLLRMGDERAQIALCKLTLNDLVRDIVKGRWLS